MKRGILIVLDGLGIGKLPDAARYGDIGSDTLGHIDQRFEGLRLPHLEALGLGNVRGFRQIKGVAAAKGCFGRMVETALGKDSTTGHWELMGVKAAHPFQTFPHGFPKDLIDAFCRATGFGAVLGNKTASGTAIIEELGVEHLKTGLPIVYTSADPVLQIAAHEEVVAIDRLYQLCEAAFKIAVPFGISRVIARPFIGEGPGRFKRTERRRDFSVPPPPGSLLDQLNQAHIPIYGVGKVDNLFADQGFTTCVHTKDNNHGINEILARLQITADLQERCFLFANLVDFDTIYGHPNDLPGFARALQSLDQRLPEILSRLQDDDLLLITADHGNDPGDKSTDHTREYVPLLVVTKNTLGSANGKSLGERLTFADVGQTLADFFALPSLQFGESFLREVMES